jgi:hypothetical protein
VAVEKFRRKAAFADGLTSAGSVGFSGTIQVNTTMRLGAPVIAPIGSASNAFAGVVRINSGATSATQSTQAINSGGLVFVSPVLVGAGVASFNLIGQIVVTTVAQAASGGYFSLGFTGTQNGLAAPVDVPWFIINPAP